MQCFGDVSLCVCVCKCGWNFKLVKDVNWFIIGGGNQVVVNDYCKEQEIQEEMICGGVSVC